MGVSDGVGSEVDIGTVAGIEAGAMVGTGVGVADAGKDDVSVFPEEPKELEISLFALPGDVLGVDRIIININTEARELLSPPIAIFNYFIFEWGRMRIVLTNGCRQGANDNTA